MKTKKMIIYGLFAVILALSFTACDDGNSGNGGDKYGNNTVSWERLKRYIFAQSRGNGPRIIFSPDENNKKIKYCIDYDWANEPNEWQIKTVTSFANDKITLSDGSSFKVAFPQENSPPLIISGWSITEMNGTYHSNADAGYTDEVIYNW